MTPQRLAEIEARREAITIGDGDWHRMEYEDGSLMPDYISAGQSKEGYSLDIIMSEFEHVENMEFIAHAPTDTKDLIAEIKRLRDDMAEIVVESGKVDIDNWPAQQQICQSIANKSLGRDINGKEPKDE